jgi:succinyl-CoA synthetase beta subunit
VGDGPERWPDTERAVLDHLARHGVPVVPATLVTDEASAVAAAASFRGPVVLKIASADIQHKSDIGGVALNVAGEAAVAAAFRRVMAAAPAGARVDGVLVSPMRERGLELFVGCTRDPQWGAVLAVGLGGIFVEVLQDVALRVLPVTPAEVRRMLGELKGAKMLQGQRGVPAADLDAVAEAIARIGDAAVALGSDLDELDVNPLWVRGSRVEALDGLAVAGAD